MIGNLSLGIHVDEARAQAGILASQQNDYDLGIAKRDIGKELDRIASAIARAA